MRQPLKCISKNPLKTIVLIIIISFYSLNLCFCCHYIAKYFKKSNNKHFPEFHLQRLKTINSRVTLTTQHLNYNLQKAAKRDTWFGEDGFKTLLLYPSSFILPIKCKREEQIIIATWGIILFARF